LTLWTALLGIGIATAAGFFLYSKVILPLSQLRETLRRLAAGDFRPVLMNSRKGVFKETSGHVRRISEQLQQLDRQIADEGFSLRAILSSMVEGVLITDHTQRIRLINEPLHRMFEMKQSPINRTIMEVFCNHELQQAIEQALLDGNPRHIEISLQSPEREGYSTKHLEVCAGGLNPKPRGLTLGAVVVFHDITAVKNLEGVRREFVANVSHEFRTPLAIINGYIETLLDGALDDRPMAEKSLKVMHRNGERLTLLIEDLLTISRMEHRSPQIELQYVALPSVLHRVIEGLEPAIAERHASVTVDCPPEAAEIEADPRRIEQVFANLLENALRHGPADGALIRIAATRRQNDLEIVFSDNGPGIPYDDQPHIFERFYRVHKDRSRTAGGTGLGLSIVKHIVQAHGGSVSVESVPGHGASFKVLLPVSQNPPPKKTPQAAHPLTSHAA